MEQTQTQPRTRQFSLLPEFPGDRLGRALVTCSEHPDSHMRFQTRVKAELANGNGTRFMTVAGPLENGVWYYGAPLGTGDLVRASA